MLYLLLASQLYVCMHVCLFNVLGGQQTEFCVNCVSSVRSTCRFRSTSVQLGRQQQPLSEELLHHLIAARLRQRCPALNIFVHRLQG